MESKEKIELTKIGFVTILGLIAIVTGVFWLKGHKIHNYQRFVFYFKNVNGLEEGAAMRWNGLKIGVVEKVSPVQQDMQLKPFPAEQLIRLGREHLKLAQKSLKRSSPEDLVFVREYINKGQLEIALGQISKAQSNIKKGEHVKVEAVVTMKDVPIAHLNRVTISPSGLIGEQYLDIVSFDFSETSFEKLNWKALKNKGQDGPYFVILEPIRLDHLMRASVESAEAIRDLTNRFNSLVEDKDVQKIRELVDSFNRISANEKVGEDIKESMHNFREFSENLKEKKIKIWDFIF